MTPSLTGNRIRVLIGIPLLSLLLLRRSYNFLQQSHYYEATAKPEVTTLLPTTGSSSAPTGVKNPTESNIQNDHKKRPISLIVRMKGEMSNLISHLVFGKGIQWWAEEHYNLKIDLIGERQAGTKWKGAVHDLQTCFPNLRSIHFQGGRWDNDFKIRRQQQREWVGEENKTKLNINRADSNCGTTEWFCLHEQLAFLRQIMQQEIPEHILANATQENNNYSLPFIASDQQASFDVLVDQYYPKIKEWLKFDYAACCSPEQPDPDEVVFVSILAKFIVLLYALFLADQF